MVVSYLSGGSILYFCGRRHLSLCGVNSQFVQHPVYIIKYIPVVDRSERETVRKEASLDVSEKLYLQHVRTTVPTSPYVPKIGFRQGGTKSVVGTTVIGWNKGLVFTRSKSPKSEGYIQH